MRKIRSIKVDGVEIAMSDIVIEAEYIYDGGSEVEIMTLEQYIALANIGPATSY